ncbi:hypothetical protein [Enterococcus casseliflavus]|uniref:hypothetical protein n=1 Tax=Enterococcus casseliflavus TaxID=37734 RepID=UPI0022E8D344|nr:hypothetical protein [Enterococcus casseliflavus]
MILEQPNMQKKFEKEFKLLEKKNSVRSKSFRKHHLLLREQANSQEARVSKRLEQFNSQSR